MNVNIYSKEAIKARMYRMAATFWNMQNVDGLDPVMRLLIEAVAEEIYSISDNVNTMESRLLEKLANILTPDILIASSPAHGVIHSRAIDAVCSIDDSCGFSYDKSAIIKRLKVNNLIFTPLCKTPFYKGDVAYMIADGLLYKYDTSRRKQLIARSDSPYTDAGRVWIALELDEDITSLQNMSFYFDFPNTPNKDEYLYLLSYVECRINGSRVPLKRGIYTSEEDENEQTASPFFKYEISNRIDSNILKVYQNHYMSVEGEVSVNPIKNDTKPDILNQLYEEDELQNIVENNLVWLSFDFPPNFTEYVLDDMTVNINTVPVANKFRCNINGKVEDVLGIIPLTTKAHEYFLSMDTVRDGSGKHYYEIFHQSEGKKDENVGTYSLRRGGCERFDERNAHDFLTRLTDLLSDESAAFAYKLRGNLAEVVNQMEILVTQMYRLNQSGNTKEILSYLLIDNLQKDTVFDVQFWATNCEIANKLRAGTHLAPSVSAMLDGASSVLLTSTYGGRREPKSRERLEMYKYVLTTGDRIVTADDIKNFCRMHLGDMISDIQVSKGVAVSEKPKEGLVRTIDVHITLKSHLKGIGNFDSIAGDTKNKLRDKSPDTYNYRVFVKSKEEENII